MNWTKEKPTKNGWYWWRSSMGMHGKTNQPIYSDQIIQKVWDSIFLINGITVYTDKIHGQFSGPIPEPKD